MLKRLGEFTCALLFGIEQPNVPNRNHRLIGEGLQQRDLPLGERSDVGSCNRNHSNGLLKAVFSRAGLGSVRRKASSPSALRP